MPFTERLSPYILQCTEDLKFADISNAPALPIFLPLWNSVETEHWDDSARVHSVLGEFQEYVYMSEVLMWAVWSGMAGMNHHSHRRESTDHDGYRVNFRRLSGFSFAK